MVVGGLCQGRPMSDTSAESLRGQTFRGRDLRKSRFIACDLSGVVVRGSEVAGMEIDSPWLLEGESPLLVNGVDVVPVVDAELNRRFPGRGLRGAEDPEGLRVAWAALEETWAATLDRAATMPPGTVDASVDGEWSFAQTLRHLVMATDTWLGKAILELEQPYHPAGLPHDDGDTEAYDPSTFSSEAPPFPDVLEARADRQAMVRDFLASVTQEELAAPRKTPHAPAYPETVLSCLRTILEEEWEHHRYAVRDLAALASAPSRTFVPAEFEPPTALVTDRFRLEPLGPQHNDADHAAWTSSIEHIRSTPGYPDGDWPPVGGMTLEDNLADLRRHAADFGARKGFTFTVLDPADGDVIGCVYLYPAASADFDVTVQSWVRADRADRADLDGPLADAVAAWLAAEWPWQRADRCGR
jgi:hypothetical protein